MPAERSKHSKNTSISPSERQRTRVFLSYSRKDAAEFGNFAEVMRDQLIERDFDAYLDIHDILPGEDWKRRLRGLLETSDTMVFCISPRSVVSNVCEWEVTEAENLSKRLLPVMVVDTSEAKIPGRLKRLNYIYMRDGDDREAAFEALAESIDRNIEWIREHTRIGQRALEWAETNRSHAKLLQGDDISDAESWRDSPNKSATDITQLQLSYIAKSREIWGRNQRRRSWIASVVALVATGLAGLAGWQWQVAETNREKSNHNLGLAFLTNAENLMGEEKPARAYVASGLGSGLLSRPESGTYAAYLRPGTAANLRATTIFKINAKAAHFPQLKLRRKGASNAVALSQSGTYFAYAGQDGKAFVQGLNDAAPRIMLEGHKRRINDLEFGKDANFIATAGFDNVVGLWNLKKLEAQALCGHKGRIRQVSLHPSRSLIASASNDGTVRVWDRDSGKPISKFSDNDGWALSVIFSPDGRWMAYADQRGNISVRETTDWRLVTKLQSTSDNLISIAFNSDASELAVAGVDGVAEVWRVATRTLKGSLKGYSEKLWRIALVSGGKAWATADWGGNVRLWDVETLRHQATFDAHDHWVTDVSFSAQRPLMITGSEDHYIRLWNIEDAKPSLSTLRDHDEEVLRASYSADGRVFATASRDKTVIVYSQKSSGRYRKICPRLSMQNWVLGLALQPNGKRLATAATSTESTKNTIQIWDVESCAPVREIGLGLASVNQLAYSPSGRYLAASSPDGLVQVWRTDDLSLVNRLKGHVGPVYDFAFDPSGTALATAGQDKKVLVWNLEDGNIKHHLEGHRAGVWKVAFSPDGKYLVSAGGEKRILLWDWQHGSSLATPVKTNTSVSGLVFNYDGRWLAIGDDDRSISIWDTDSWKRTAILSSLVGVRGPLVTAPASDTLVFDGDKGVVRFWHLSPAPMSRHTKQAVDFTVKGVTTTFSSTKASNSAASSKTVKMGTCS